MEALAGILLVARTRSLWGLAFGPLLGAVAAYIGLGFLVGGWVVPRLIEGAMGRFWPETAAGGQAGAAGTLGSLLFAALWLLLFSYIFIILAGLFSGFVWDRLSAAVEDLEGGPVAPPVALGGMVMALDAGTRLVFNGAIGVIGLLLSLLLGPIPGLVAAGIVGLLDYTSPAYARRGQRLGGQLRSLCRRPEGRTLGFALVAGTLSLVPLIGVLLMPGLVAGGTLLIRRREARE